MPVWIRYNSEEIFEVKHNILKFYIKLLNEINSRFDFKREDIKLLQIITPSKKKSNTIIACQFHLQETIIIIILSLIDML